jgi:hypothetical protein
MQEVFRQGGAGVARSGRLRLTFQATGGEKRERVMRLRYKGEPNVRKSLLLVEGPADARGTGFVSIEYPVGKQPAERWIYLAHLKRSSRIAGGQMSSSFLGSDLSFSDLSQPDPAGFDLKLVKESENVGGEDCWVVSAKAKDPTLQAESGYAEATVWISKQKQTMVRVRAPLTASKATKYIEASDFAKVGEQFVPKKLVIRTVEDGKVRSESVLETLELKLDPTVADTDFTKQRLEAGP